MTSRALYVAWKDPDDGGWSVIGRLTRDGEQLAFNYTRGFDPTKCRRIADFPDIDRTYTSSSLFPFFQNRTMPRSRPDFADFARRYGLPEDATPWQQLEGGAGTKATDTYEVFPLPAEEERDGRRFLTTRFFLRGVSHVPTEVRERIIAELKSNERLWAMTDPQNENDPDAIALRWSSPEISALVGFVPRYLAPDVGALLRAAAPELRMEVLSVNPPPAPHTQRVLVRLSAPWPEGFEPFARDDFQPR